MRIDTTKLAENKELFIAEEWDAASRDLNVFGLIYSSALRVEARAKRDSGLVSVSVKMQALATCTCSRCGVEFQKPIDWRKRFVYPIEVENKFLALEEDVRQELVLTSPQTFLCQSSCRGFCLKCGKNLNSEECQCEAGNRGIQQI